MKPTLKEDKLTLILHAGDPVAHTGPMGAAEAAHIRARVRAASRARTSRWWKPWALAAAVATAALVMVAAPYGLFPGGAPTTTPSTAGPGIEVPVAPDRREIHFTAPNGTRIIWSLRKDGDRPQETDDPEIRS